MVVGTTLHNVVTTIVQKRCSGPELGCEQSSWISTSTCHLCHLLVTSTLLIPSPQASPAINGRQRLPTAATRQVLKTHSLLEEVKQLVPIWNESSMQEPRSWVKKMSTAWQMTCQYSDTPCNWNTYCCIPTLTPDNHPNGDIEIYMSYTECLGDCTVTMNVAAATFCIPPKALPAPCE